MSYIEGPFDVFVLKTGTFDPQLAQRAGAVIFFNLSPNDLVITPPNSQGWVAPANTIRIKHYEGGFPSAPWKFSQLDQAAITGPYSTVAIVEALTEGVDEIPPEEIIGLTRQANVGQVVSTATVTQVQQDGQPTGQLIVEATPTGQAQSILWTTDGLLTIRPNNAGSNAFHLQSPDNTEGVYIGVANAGSTIPGWFVYDGAAQAFIIVSSTNGGMSVQALLKANNGLAATPAAANNTALTATATNAQGNRVAAIVDNATSGQNADLIDFVRAVNQPQTFTLGIDSTNDFYLYDVRQGFFFYRFFADGHTELGNAGGGKVLCGEIDSTNPIFIKTGNQPAGKTGVEGWSVSGSNLGMGTNFGVHCVNIPSSITFTADSAVNVNSGPTANFIDRDGFHLEFQGFSGAGGAQCRWWGRYTTVGNCIKGVQANWRTFTHHCDGCDTLRSAIPFDELERLGEPVQPGAYGLAYRCPTCGQLESFNTGLTLEDEVVDATGKARLVNDLVAALGYPLHPSLAARTTGGI